MPALNHWKRLLLITGFILAGSFVACQSSLAQAPEAEAEATQQDLKQLQGEWTIVSAQVADAPEEALAEMIGGVLAFDDHNFSMREKDAGGDSPVYKTTFQLDSTTSPKQITISTMEAQADRPASPEAPGIFELKGDRLTLCLPAGEVTETVDQETGERVFEISVVKRPQAIDPKQGVVFVLERKKP